MQYRRSQASGATFFFTVVTYKRKRILCNDENAALIKSAFRQIMQKRPFDLDAFVMLPDHLHCIWTLPDNDNDFSTRWQTIKNYFTRRVDDNLKNVESENMSRKGLRGIWQQRFWEHQVRDDEDFAAHVDYIHYNPVKHGYVRRPNDWKYTSFHRYVKKGIYDMDWGSTGEIKFDDNVGNE